MNYNSNLDPATTVGPQKIVTLTRGRLALAEEYLPNNLCIYKLLGNLILAY